MPAAPMTPPSRQSCRPANMSASANPKSSTGRLDIFTRVITDHAQEFDKIPAGYSGPLYLEISPRTFPIVVRRGSRLSQIRFRIGHSLLNEGELLKLHETETLVASESPNVTGGGIALSIDLKGFGENGLIFAICYALKTAFRICSSGRSDCNSAVEAMQGLSAKASAQNLRGCKQRRSNADDLAKTAKVWATFRTYSWWNIEKF